MARPKMNDLSRRGFVKKSAAAALTLGVVGPAIIIPGRAQQKTLKILKWKHFVPEFDRQRSAAKETFKTLPGAAAYDLIAVVNDQILVGRLRP